jgi:hypothetical protein
MDHGESVESSANKEAVEAEAEGSSPKMDLEVASVAAGGDVPNRDMLKTNYKLKTQPDWQG